VLARFGECVRLLPPARPRRARAARAQGRNKRKRTSQFRGVSKVGAKWKATITSNGAKHELGRFDTELQAAQCAAPAFLALFFYGGLRWLVGCRLHITLPYPGLPSVPAVQAAAGWAAP
jgi:hypothetical protein